MEKQKILSKQEVLETGLEFDGEKICYSGQYADELYIFSDGKGERYTGIVYELYDNGNINYYCYYVDGIKNGEYVSFYENGKVKRYSIMYRGTKHGKTTYFYENGMKKSEDICKYNFVLSKKEWDEDGNLKSEQTEPDAFSRKMIEKYDASDARRKKE